MSAVYDAFNNDERWAGRILTAAAHLMLWAVAAIALSLASRYFGFDSWVTRKIFYLAAALVLIGMMHNTYTRLCVRCMREVPADAGTRAQRQGWVLWVNHANTRWFGVAGYIACWLSLDWLVDRFDLPAVAWLPIDAVTIVYLYSVWLHHRLRPWCRYCPDWDGGGGIPEPSPDPVVKSTR